MTEASSSCRPLAASTAPRPALKSGSSSSDLHRGHDRVEARAARVEHREAGAQRTLEAGAVGAVVLGGEVGGGERARAAVDGNGVHVGVLACGAAAARHPAASSLSSAATAPP